MHSSNLMICPQFDRGSFLSGQIMVIKELPCNYYTAVL